MSYHTSSTYAYDLATWMASRQSDEPMCFASFTFEQIQSDYDASIACADAEQNYDESQDEAASEGND